MTSLPCGCAVCSRVQRTCCQSSEPYVSRGDMDRIYNYRSLPTPYWCGFRIPPQEYLAGCRSDPAWAAKVLTPTGWRRVVLARFNGNCVFLEPTGCVLPMEVKPLVCRIYPWDFFNFKITGLSSYCAVEARGEHQDMGEALGLTAEQAQTWLDQLRDEP
jgi:Fe-S-cluster containining protein